MREKLNAIAPDAWPGAEARLAGGSDLEDDLAGRDPRVAGEDAAQERPSGDERALVHRRDQPPGPLAFGGREQRDRVGRRRTSRQPRGAKPDVPGLQRRPFEIVPACVA